jgi:ribonuclease VapC
VIVLDSSAVLAIALNEPGAANVLAALPEAVLSSANLAEVLIVAERKGKDSEQVFERLFNLGLQIAPVSATHAKVAGLLWRAQPTLNLSLGDRLCLALALEQNGKVLTSDREMTKIGLGLKVELFR